MSDLHTIITDDDGDGIYDDIHVVNVMDDHSRPSEPVVVHHRHDRSSFHISKSTPIFSGKTKVKIAIAIFIISVAFLLVVPSAVWLISAISHLFL